MNRRTTVIAIMLSIVPCLLLFQGCSTAPPVWPDKPGKKILTTFAPLYCFTEIIAGDDANVMCLLTTSGPHGADWSSQDVLKVRGADLVVANGLGLDEGLVQQLVGSASKKVPVLEVGDVLKKKHHELLDIGEHKHAEGDKDGHHHGSDDPHIWLGPKRARAMVDIICDRLAELDPPNAAGFRKRADAFKEKLDELAKYGISKFKDKKNRKIVTQHDSMAYFAAEFGLEVVGSVKMKDNLDAWPGKVIDVCEKKLPAAFTYEGSAKSSDVESIRNSLKKKGISTELAEVDPIEQFIGNPAPAYYLQRMYKNIDNLAQALP